MAKPLPPNLRPTLSSGELVLTDGIILNLERQPAIVAAFPWVKVNMVTPAADPRKCGKCRPASQRQAGVNEASRIKQMLVDMTEADKVKFKGMIRTTKVSLYISTPNGVKHHSF